MSNTFPLFDLAAFEAADTELRQRYAAQLDDICRSTGFVAVSNHGVSERVIENIWSSATDFFDQPAPVKSKSSAPEPGYPYGYIGPGVEALAKSKGVETPPDLKETFNGGPANVPPGITDPDALAFCYAPTIWPELPGFREAWQTYYQAMDDLAGRIMRAFAAALQLPENRFESAISHPISALRAIHYPATDASALENQERAGAHTDYGSLTILLPQPGSRGLQVEHPTEGWIDVPPVEGAFVINIGDLMARWTNDRWVSTLHRVVHRPNQPRRFSLAFFHQPNWDAAIDCLPSCIGDAAKYDTVNSGPYLMSKFQSTTM
ncbi:MAG: 2OG-Fe(II) oxygenase family protein [Pseudomonadota bacterium]